MFAKERLQEKAWIARSVDGGFADKVRAKISRLRRNAEVEETEINHDLRGCIGCIEGEMRSREEDNSGEEAWAAVS